MAQMTLRAFVNNFSSIVDQSKVSMALKLARGSIGSLEEYKREVGRIEGMDSAVSLMRDMLGRLEAGEDDDLLPEMPQGNRTPGI